MSRRPTPVPTAPAPPWPAWVTGRGAAAVPRIPQRLGVLFPLLLVWLAFEFGRPPVTLRIPLLIAVTLGVGWALKSDKRLGTLAWGFLSFLGVMVIGIPLAENEFSAVWTTYYMVALTFVVIPLPSIVTSVRRLRVLTHALVAVAVFVGIWAMFHGGYGPSGAFGGQDENYVAALMGMSIPLAYFSIYCESRRVVRTLLVLAILVFCSATVVSFSRGGFVGMFAVGLYCIMRSRRKGLGLGMFAAVTAGVLVFASTAYLQEVKTITNYQEGTADLRLQLWAMGLRAWQASPFLGVGPGNFRWVVGEYQSVEQLEMIGRAVGGSYAHSLYVELLVDLGLVGAIIFGVIVLRTWTDLRRVQRGGVRPPGESDHVALGHYADAIRASMLAVLVNGLFLSLLYYAHIWVLVAVGSAITQMYDSRMRGIEIGKMSTPRPGARVSSAKRTRR